MNEDKEMTIDDFKKYKEEVCNKWMIDNCPKSQLMSVGMLPLKPDLGYYIKVDSLEIPQDIFPEEFKQITEAYYKVIDKLSSNYKNIELLRTKEKIDKINGSDNK